MTFAPQIPKFSLSISACSNPCSLVLLCHFDYPSRCLSVRFSCDLQSPACQYQALLLKFSINSSRISRLFPLGLIGLPCPDFVIFQLLKAHSLERPLWSLTPIHDRKISAIYGHLASDVFFQYDIQFVITFVLGELLLLLQQPVFSVNDFSCKCSLRCLCLLDSPGATLE